MNIISGLTAYSRAKDAASANHISGWIGTAAAVIAGVAVSKGWVAEIQAFVCQATMDDIGLAVGVIVAAGSWANSLSTKALMPKLDAQNAPSIAPAEPIKPVTPEYPQPKD